MAENEFRLIQDGMVVAWAWCEREIAHYAFVYGQDGPVTIQQLVGKRWRDLTTPPHCEGE